MQHDDALAAVGRFPRFKRLGVVVLCLLILSDGAWIWFGSRSLTAQEQAFVGRWRVTVTSQLNLYPPYVDVWEIKPDRTLQILRDVPKLSGNLVVPFDCNWKVRNKLVVDRHPPRHLRHYVHRFQEFVEFTQRLERMPSHQSLYDIKSTVANRNVLWRQVTFKPVSDEVFDMVRLTESTPSS